MEIIKKPVFLTSRVVKDLAKNHQFNCQLNSVEYAKAITNAILNTIEILENQVMILLQLEVLTKNLLTLKEVIEN